MFRGRTLILVVLLFLYLGSYLVLSRRGFAVTDEMGIKGSFWFFEPQPTAGWEIANYGCVLFYAPVIFLDYHFLGNRQPAGIPLLELDT